MKIHRFYTPDLNQKHGFWVQKPELLHQWTKVLRFRVGQQIVLFDGKKHDRLYKIIEIGKDEAHLEMITDYERRLPAKNLYLFWSLLKKDKNDWVLQKATELGVSHFIPLLADRSEKTGFNMERANKIVIEAAEQCGRSDIPLVRDAMHIANAVAQYKNKIALYVCEQGTESQSLASQDIGVLIGPEGGWSESEKQLFSDSELAHLQLHDFTLRAETAAITSVIKMLQ